MFDNYTPQKRGKTTAIAVSLIFSLELLLYFQFLNNDSFGGLGVYIGRLYQVILLPILFALVLLCRRILVHVNFFNALSPYLLLLFFIPLMALVSVVFGQYDYQKLPGAVKFRPIVEYVLYIYQFLLFFLVPVIFIKRQDLFVDFLRYIQIVLRISVFFGLIDFVFHLLFGIDLIARQMYDGVDVGTRFHGFFGEPRDAAVILIFMIFIDHLYNYCVYGEFKINNKNLLIYIVLVLMTKSLSSVVGISLSLLILAVFYPSYVFVRSWRYFILFIFVFSIFVFIVFQFDRMQLYLSGAWLVYNAIVYGDFTNFPPVFVGQLPNVYPMSVFVGRILSFDFLETFSLFFGSGLGSVAFINGASFFGGGTLLNPHSNLLRLLVDFGILGTWLYIFAHVKVFKYFSSFVKLSSGEVVRLMFISSIIVGMALSQRSPIALMTVGVLLSYINIVSRNPAS